MDEQNIPNKKVWETASKSSLIGDLSAITQEILKQYFEQKHNDIIQFADEYYDNYVKVYCHLRSRANQKE